MVRIRISAAGPMTEFVFDPLLLTWAMTFVGWLSHEVYDYPDQYCACGGDNREEEEEGADPSPSGAQEGERGGAEDHRYHYPRATHREYFMMREEVLAEEA